MNHSDKSNTTEDMSTIIFTNIFTIFSNLQYLNFVPCSIFCQILSFYVSSPPIFSSNLLELHVNLNTFTDCLYLLDGRSKQLRKFYVNISGITPSHLVIDNQVNYYFI